VIAGTGRSGTTWVLDTLARANGLRTVFEPLHPAAVRGAARFAHRWAAPDAEWPELERFMARALSGRFVGLWPDLRVRGDRMLDPREPLAWIGQYRRLLRHGAIYLRERRRPPLVKFIRANLMLGWLVRRFGARVLLVVRHPGGVVASTMKLGGPDWHHAFRLQAYREEPALAPWLDRLASVLGPDPSPVTAHTALWCVENAIPLELAAEWGVVPVHYEFLLRGDEDEWRRALAALELERRPEDEALSRPSQQVSREMRGATFDAAQAGRWMQHLGPAEREEMARVLCAFGVDAYSLADPFPAARSANAPGAAASGS
jgi:hypothetical protein